MGELRVQGVGMNRSSNKFISEYTFFKNQDLLTFNVRDNSKSEGVKPPTK